ncbi:MAG: hypothetical protein JSW55_11695 [Chloroflexota bacterium]|nr:MAG: hypothetical protein JSW55_11695 [Chloroflexota bacterium]
MRIGKELIGKPIYSITDGRQQGTVKDLYVDLELKLLKGIYLGREGLINRRTRVITREDVAVFGFDAVLTAKGDVATDNSQVPEVDVWLRRDVLQNREIETAGGTKVGTVGDVLFDERATVAGVWLARVHVAGPIAEKKMLSRAAITDTGGRDGVMIVDLSLAERPAAEEGEKPPAAEPTESGSPANAAESTTEAARQTASVSEQEQDSPTQTE